MERLACIDSPTQSHRDECARPRHHPGDFCHLCHARKQGLAFSRRRDGWSKDVVPNTACRIFSKNIHVAHVLIDGAVDAPDTLGKMLVEERFKELRESRGGEYDGLMLPEKIAETFGHSSHKALTQVRMNIDQA